jgi:hypothetical protein
MVRRIPSLLLAAGLLGTFAVACAQILGIDDAQTVERPVYTITEAGPLPTCAEGRLSCRGGACDTDIATDMEHCGGCGRKCQSANGKASCTAGVCAVTCDEGRLDCDGNLANGCETNPSNDDQHCGACGHACLGAQCLAGACVPALVGLAPAAVATLETDNDLVYVSSSDTRAFPIGGGPAVTVDSQGGPMALRNGSVFTFGGGQVRRNSRNGLHHECYVADPRGSVTRLTDGPASIAWTGALDNATYFRDGGLNPIATEMVDYDGGCPPDAGPVSRSLGIVEGRQVGRGIALDGEDVFVSTTQGGSGAFGEALSAGALFRISRLGGDAGTATVLASPVRPPTNGLRLVSVDETYVYYVDASAFVRRVPRAGCGDGGVCNEQMYFEPVGTVFALRVDERFIYALGDDNTFDYLVIIDKKTKAVARKLLDVALSRKGDIAFSKDYVLWAFGQKVFRLSR